MTIRRMTVLVFLLIAAATTVVLVASWLHRGQHDAYGCLQAQLRHASYSAVPVALPECSSPLESFGVAQRGHV
jgi:hypothetical protein